MTKLQVTALLAATQVWGLEWLFTDAWGCRHLIFMLAVVSPVAGWSCALLIPVVFASSNLDR